MLKNYFKIALRNLIKNRVHSFINITGLALGMAAATLLLLNIQYGLSIDQFHKKKAQIYEAYMKGVIDGNLSCWNTTSALLGPSLQVYPAVRNVARVMGSSGLFRYEDKKIQAVIDIADPAFLSMFSFPLEEGSIQTALRDPNDIVVTRQLAVKLFGGQDPMGKIVTSPSGKTYTVTGVLRDLPPNTQFNFECLLPWSHLHGPFQWNQQNTFTFVELLPGANVDAINRKLIDKAAKDNASSTAGAAASDQTSFLYPLTKVYLENKFVNGKPAGGNIDNLRMLGGLAAIILLIACINFMNLSTARSEKRAREVGIRKVVGSTRYSLIVQFIGESVLLAFLAGIIALVLVQLAIPYFNTLTRVRLSVPWESPLFWLAATFFVFFTGLLAGSYPAFYISSFRPIKVLKGVLQNGNALVTPRRILVVVQFVFSIFLINFTVIYQKQIRYELDRDAGYAKNGLIYQEITPELRKNYAVVKNELLAMGTASSVSESNTSVTQVVGTASGFKWDGMDPSVNPGFALMFEDGGLIHTNGLSLIAGRDIDLQKYPGDTLSCVINETSVRLLGFKDPIGRIIQDDDQRWKIVGVVKDFLAGAADQVSPPVLIKGGVIAGVINIRLNGDRPLAQNIQQTEAILKKYNPGFLTDLRFADKDYSAKFQQARDTALLINTFTFIAIFISCMGLLGLATYTTQNRTREIGIRKILGSSISSIVVLLSRDFARLVLLSILIASPLAWFFMNFFLSRYSYRTSPNGWILAASGFAALLMALVTISFQVMQAALANPVRNLRTE